MEFPQEIKVILESNDFWTNTLLVLNIIVTIIVSLFVRNFIEKKSKEYEVKAHSAKIIASKIIDFCVKTHKTLSMYCSKNPNNDITLNDVNDVQNIIKSEEIIFIDNKFILELEDFCDYLISLKDNPSKKDLEKEKFFFHKLRSYINV